MNKKLSGAQLVLVPIERMGQNRFPYVENLRNRVIKYIDFYGASYLPGTATAGVTDPSDMFITVMDEYGNSRVHNNLPLIRMDYTQTLGVRQGVFSRISLRDCYVTCQNAANVGKLAAFIFWYDLPEFSARNKTDYVITDSVSIPLTTATRYNRLPDEEKPGNLHFIRMDAKEILDYFPEESVDRIYLNFSDPWPKPAHAARRLTSHQFLERYEQILKEQEVI